MTLSNRSLKYFTPCFHFYPFFDSGPQVGGLFSCTGFFHVLKIAALISLIANDQAVTTKQPGPLESVNVGD